MNSIEERDAFNENFNKQFPSIHNQGWQALTHIMPFTKWMSQECKEVVQKHTIDKAVLKELILELSWDKSGKGDLTMNVNDFIRRAGLGKWTQRGWEEVK